MRDFEGARPGLLAYDRDGAPMHPHVAAFARQHGLAPSVAAALDEWWARHGPATTRPPDDYDSVNLDGPSDAPAGAPTLTDRYEDLGPIAAGGMGEVRRVRDRVLNRSLAMKLVHGTLAGRPAAVARFLEEAQATAQLQHPNIVPVHDLGTLPDGRVWFTMKEVRGRTLSDVIAEVHRADRPDPTWTFRRLVTAFLAVCQAVAYAHDRGVVHRDLKPDNVMLGARGEVYVLDWGLAKILGRPDLASQDGELDPVVSDRSQDHATRMGQVAGTPAYMPPEQASGDIDRIDARSDVYALGAMLRTILAGAPPYAGPAKAVLAQVLDGPPPPLDRQALPEELVVACERAMARAQEDRFPTAAALAEEVAAWLEGSRRRERALEIVAHAEATTPEAAAFRDRAAALRSAAAAELERVPTWAPEEAKLAAWAKQDEAARLETQAALKELEREQLLAGSLTHAPDLPEAHLALAEDQWARHAAAERARDPAGAARAEALLRSHTAALPASHPTRRRAAAYLTGTGAVSLVTDPPGAQVELYRYEPRGRRLVARHVASLGRTPLVERPLEMGSWLLVLTHPGHAEVRYPVHLGRGAHWDGIRPGDREPRPVALPRLEDLGPDDCYVPGGWFQAGGTAAYAAVRAGPWWCDPFVLRRFPVTNREYLAFLDDLTATGREEEALRCAPRELAGQHGVEGAPIYGRDDQGRFVLVADAQGDRWEPDWPVVLVDWHGASAYTRWYADRTGSPWRLPWDLEWEKAARGADGRTYPWGDGFDPSYCNMRFSLEGRPLPRVVQDFPVDESPYGVRGLAGNVRDWCADVWTMAGPSPSDRVVAPHLDPGALGDQAQRVDRGGVWNGLDAYCRAAGRYGVEPSFRVAYLGFRLARPWS